MAKEAAYLCPFIGNIPTDVCSAHILGAWTVLAGFFVLLAGLLAYAAATRQVRLEENKHNSRCVAYKNLLLEYVIELLVRNSVIMAESRKINQPGSFKLKAWPISLPEEFLPQYWENHALLGKKVVKKIIALRRAHERYANFQNEILSGLKSDELSENELDSGVTSEDGSIVYKPLVATEAYILVADELGYALANLNNALAKLK